MLKFYFMGNFILNNEGSDVGNAAITMVTDLNLWLCMIFMLPPKTILIKQSFALIALIGQITNIGIPTLSYWLTMSVDL